jgi:hypothetical protein
MATTRFVLTPFSAEFPATNFPNLDLINRRPVLSFDADTKETCYWTFVAPQGLTGTLHAKIQYIMASATTGDVDVNVAVEAITDADATDLDSSTSFATVNAVDNTSVPGTAGYIDVIDVTLTNADSIAAGDYVRISLDRDSADDTATGDMCVLSVEITDGN